MKVLYKNNIKKANHLYIKINIENWLLMQKTTLCAPQWISYPLNVYISMPCTLTVVHHVVLAWRNSWFASGVAPMGGKPTVTLCVHPLRFFSGIFLRLRPGHTQVQLLTFLTHYQRYY